MTDPALPGKRPRHGHGRGYGQVQARSWQAFKFPRTTNRPPQEQSAIGGVRAFAEISCHFVPQHMVPSPISARVEENSQPKACRHTGFHIADLVTQDRTCAGSKPRSEIACTWRGHTPGFEFVPGIFECVCRKPIAHPSCQILVGVLVEAATPNAGPIGDDDDLPVQLVGPESSNAAIDRQQVPMPLHIGRETELPLRYNEANL